MNAALNNRILVADDEADVLQLVGSNLSNAGFQVLQALDGATAMATARRDLPALIVLDIMMPGMSGIEVTRMLKRDAATAAISIVLLSARSEEVDRILGFELGADDFVSKPFSPRELVLRIRSILSRKAVSVDCANVLQIGQVVVDQQRHWVSRGGRAIDLTALEFKLLVALMRAAGCVLNREELLQRVWGNDTAIETRTIDTHVRRLRDKLGKAGDQIQTVRGFGYRIEGA